MMFGLFIIGLVSGIILTVGWGAFEGIFGRGGSYAVLFVLFGLFALSLADSGGVEAGASTIYPWPYWVGLFVGCVVSTPIAEDVESKIRRNGQPLVVGVVA